jgi:hypothetical protein
LAGGIERAGTTSVARSGATCLVGSGDGIGARRMAAGAALGWVARAGVDVRARRTGVRLRALFAVARTFFLTAFSAKGFLAAGFFDAVLLAFVLLAFVLLAFVLLAFVLLAFVLLALPFAVRFATTSVTAVRVDLLAAFLRVVGRTAPVVFFRDAAAFNCFPLFGLWPRPSSRTPRNFPGPPYFQEF